MKYQQRCFYEEPDKYAMAGLAQSSAGDNLHVVDLPYRLRSWALDDPDNIRLWFDQEERLAARAVLQTPFWAIDYACDPTAEAPLHLEILAWVDRRALEIISNAFGRPAWFVTVYEEQAKQFRDLEDAGFQCQADVSEDSWSKVLMRCMRPCR